MSRRTQTPYTSHIEPSIWHKHKLRRCLAKQKLKKIYSRGWGRGLKMLRISVLKVTQTHSLTQKEQEEEGR
jgi:hypothetical protein